MKHHRFTGISPTVACSQKTAVGSRVQVQPLEETLDIGLA